MKLLGAAAFCLVAALLVASIYNESIPAPRTAAVVVPSKTVVAKVQTSQNNWFSGEFNLLVAKDKTVCVVSLPAYAATPIGESVTCDWRDWN